MHKKEPGKIAIVVLSGALKKTKKGWQTTGFNDKGDFFGVCGDRLRILAASVVYASLKSHNKSVFVVASGGRGRHLNIDKNSPFLSKIIKKELIEVGIPSKAIIEESNSGNTIEQLIESAKIVKRDKINTIIIISNRYHLPRIRAIIESSSALKHTLGKNYLVESAEDILIVQDSKKWKSYIHKIYKSNCMKKRIFFEKRGVGAIHEGTYNFNVEPKKIRTAIIGLGKIAWAYQNDPFVMKRMNYPTHLSVLKKHPNFQLVSVQDKSVEARKLFSSVVKKIQPKPNLYSDWREMIIKEAPELLVVACNTESHFDICSRAIDLGVKTILCEKPLSYNLKEAQKIIQKAKKNKCVIFINYFRAFNPSYIELIGKIKEGVIGEIQSFDAKYSKGILNNGTHLIDILTRILGEIELVKGLKNPTENISSEDPTLSAVLGFKNGANGYIHGLNNEFYSIFELDILGKSGRIKLINDECSFYSAYKSKSVKGYMELQLNNKKSSIDIKDGLYSVYDNIYLNLARGVENKCSGEQSLIALSIADRIIKSIKK